MRIFLAQLNPIVGDLENNRQKILQGIEEAKNKKADLVVFPEMALLGYPPEDLLLDPEFLDEIEASLNKLKEACKDLVVIVGTVRKNLSSGKPLYNSAAVLSEQKIWGFHDKILLPTYDVFDERRYFEPGKKPFYFSHLGKKLGVLICEDLWYEGEGSSTSLYDKDPVKDVEKEAVDYLIGISASPYYEGKKSFRVELFSSIAKRVKCPLVFSNQVGANDSLIFDGSSSVLSAKGECIKELPPFVECSDIVDVEKDLQKETYPEPSVLSALVMGVKDYFQKQGFKKAVIGVSGGIDSALVLYIAQKALGEKNVQGIFMPSRFTSQESRKDAFSLAKNLKIDLKEISIEEPFVSYLSLLEPIRDPASFGVVEENLQARIRGMILMAYSNRFGHIVLSTGNKSEMALGYSTLYGDLCGGIGVIGDVKKTAVYRLAKKINREEGELIPKNILEKAASAELKENQKDQDTLPPYEIIDLVLEEYLEKHLSPKTIALENDLDPKLVQDLIRKIHLAEYKRRQAPLCLRVSKKAFSKGRTYPIVQGFR